MKRATGNGYRMGRDADDGPKWTPVVNPRPAFEGGPKQAKRYQAAVAENPRLPDEGICEWLERVGRAATPVGDRELPREPGEEG